MSMLWNIMAFVLSWGPIANWLIAKSQKTPYSKIIKDGLVYMERFWLFNPYSTGEDGQQASSKYKWFPWNIRIHWIRRPDLDRHMHDHPWNARTIILKGWYFENRLERSFLYPDGSTVPYWRREGDTALIGYGEYHSIVQVPGEGVWTLFISGPYQGMWGFWVDGVKVAWRKYLGIEA